MFKKGQLVHSLVSGRYFIVLCEHDGRLLVKNTHNNYIG